MSKGNYIYDADNKFRAPGLAAVTTTSVVGVLALDKLVNVRPSLYRGSLGAESYKVVITVTAIDRTTGDETYSFFVDTGTAGSPTVKVGELVGITKVGQYVIELDAATIEALDPANHAALELNVAIAGTTPSITFAAWLL